MATLTRDLYVVTDRYGNIDESSDEAWLRIDCPRCAGTQAVRIAYTKSGGDGPSVVWARCVNCLHGCVVNDNVLSPKPQPLRAVRGLDSETGAVWTEIRGCLGAGADTAAVHMCRKVLMHVAVEKGLPAKDANDRAPSFVSCIEHVQNEGYVTPPMVKWVDKIREVGNEAAHELTTVSAALALLVAEFTMQLLVLTYEIPFQMEEADRLETSLDKPTEPVRRESGQ